MLEIHNLFAGYDGKAVLEDVSLTIPKGKITVVIGPNGCGKSTLLKAISGIKPADRGKILLDGQDLTALTHRELAQKIAYLPQNRQIPEITAERLVLHGRFPYLSYPRRYSRDDFEIAKNSMKKMKIEDLAHRYLNTLSGGQRQKVYIAMALAQDTDVVLMDEPTTFLDISHQLQMMEEFRLLADSGKIVALVLHDLGMSLKAADSVVILSGGRVLQQGDAEAAFTGGYLDKTFGVNIHRTQTRDGWQYYYTKQGCPRQNTLDRYSRE